jgi:DNA topoisomerase-1
MSHNLLIVESPSKAKTIKKYLGPDWKITASMGHIRDLPQSHLGVDVSRDFEPMYINVSGKNELIKSLKQDAKNADRIYLATDPDREGEAISWHLAKLLGIPPEEATRVTFNEITKGAVTQAVANPRGIDMKLVDAQQARRILDRIVGYELSPVLWKKVRKGLSAGRVQSVATRIICDREDEIEAFVPQEYWSLDALLQKDTAEEFQAHFHGRNGKKLALENEADTLSCVDALKTAVFSVKKVKKSTKRRTPPPPFITSTLQQDASRKYGFSAQKTMMVAQQLYEGVDVEGEGAVGLITYMRTDSVRLSDDALNDARNYIQTHFGKENLPKEPRRFKTKSAAQDAHEAIRPSYVERSPASLASSLNADQMKLYSLVWDRFLACQMEPAVYDTLSIEIDAQAAEDTYQFRVSGSKLVFKGFMTLYIEGTDDGAEEKDQIMPSLTEGEVLACRKLLPEQHFTQPPPRYTEATLVKTMEEKGIGRPSTYAPTIGTIVNRGYVERERKTLIPTELGRLVNNLMKENFEQIVNVNFTAEMETRLDTVEEGSIAWRELLREFYPPFKESVRAAEKNIVKVALPVEESDEVCEKCGRKMIIRTGRFGRFLACPGFPECKNTKPFVEDAGVKCPLCGGRMAHRKTKRNRKYIGCENYPTCTFLSWETPAGKDCPKCGSFLTAKTKGGVTTLTCSHPDCDYQEVGEKPVEETGGKRAATKKKSLEIVLDGALTDGAAVAEPAKKTAKKAETKKSAAKPAAAATAKKATAKKETAKKDTVTTTKKTTKKATAKKETE